MLKTFDPKQCNIIVGGFPISGFPDGTFINFEYDEADYAFVQGVDGLTSRTKMNRTSAKLTLTLQRTSASNDVLSSLRALDLKTNAPFPVLVIDNNGTSIIEDDSCWFEKLPAMEDSNEVTNREWVIQMSDAFAFCGGNR